VTRVALVVLGVALASSGCRKPPVVRQPPLAAPQPSAADRALDEARAAMTADEDRTAVRKLAAVVDGWPADPAAAEALWLIGLLRLDPQSRVRDPRAARAVFARLAAEHPGSPQAAGARAVLSVLRDGDRCDEDLTALREESTRLRDTVDAMRRLDLELERRP
jgi:hypothetical protein